MMIKYDFYLYRINLSCAAPIPTSETFTCIFFYISLCRYHYCLLVIIILLPLYIYHEFYTTILHMCKVYEINKVSKSSYFRFFFTKEIKTKLWAYLSIYRRRDGVDQIRLLLLIKHRFFTPLRIYKIKFNNIN